MRDLKETIQKVIEIANGDMYDPKEKMISKLEDVIDDIEFTAPESMNSRWEDASKILRNEIYAPITDKDEEIKKLWRDE